jgi:hypothetical protein
LYFEKILTSKTIEPFFYITNKIQMGNFCDIIL